MNIRAQTQDGVPSPEQTRINEAIHRAMEIRRCASDLRELARLILYEVLNGNATFNALSCTLEYENRTDKAYVLHMEACTARTKERMREGEELLQKARLLGIDENTELNTHIACIAQCLDAIRTGNLLSVRQLLQEKEPT